MKPETKANFLLAIAAVIWGLAFVAQRVGMDHMGPFTFNAVRFALGATVLLPVLWYSRRFNEKTLKVTANGKAAYPDRNYHTDSSKPFPWQISKGWIYLGFVLFLGASLQQVGVVHTTAGKAGFITGLYVVLVLLIGIVLGQKASWFLWAGVASTVAGLYLLSITAEMTMEYGDALVLAGAFFWAIHVQLAGNLAPFYNPVKLAVLQFSVCSAASFSAALILEEITIPGLYGGLYPLLYGGLMSVGIAYTLQLAGQKHAKPTPAAIILSLEAAFAAIGGYYALDEKLTIRAMTGCALMLAGTILAQLGDKK